MWRRIRRPSTAQLGIRKFDDLIGRADLLDMKKGIEHWKASGLDFSRLLAQPQMPADVSRFHIESQDHGLEKSLDNVLIAKSRAAIDKGEKVQFMEVAHANAGSNGKACFNTFDCTNTWVSAPVGFWQRIASQTPPMPPAR